MQNFIVYKRMKNYAPCLFYIYMNSYTSFRSNCTLPKLLQ